jgi:hypothetical protein
MEQMFDPKARSVKRDSSPQCSDRARRRIK